MITNFWLKYCIREYDRNLHYLCWSDDMYSMQKHKVEGQTDGKTVTDYKASATGYVRRK